MQIIRYCRSTALAFAAIISFIPLFSATASKSKHNPWSAPSSVRGKICKPKITGTKIVAATDSESFTVEGSGTSTYAAKSQMNADFNQKKSKALERIKMITEFDIQDGHMMNFTLGTPYISDVDCSGDDRDYFCIANGHYPYQWSEKSNTVIEVCK